MFKTLNIVLNVLKIWFKPWSLVTLMDLPPGCFSSWCSFLWKNSKKILDSGLPFDSICFKDASGTSSPQNLWNNPNGKKFSW